MILYAEVFLIWIFAKPAVRLLSLKHEQYTDPRMNDEMFQRIKQLSEEHRKHSDHDKFQTERIFKLELRIGRNEEADLNIIKVYLFCQRALKSQATTNN